MLKALARMPASDGIAAMQLINLVVINPSFVTATDPAAVELWEHYLNRWTIWNHVRTAAAMVGALLYTLGLMQNGAA